MSRKTDRVKKQPPSKDYLARMKRHQRRPLSRAAAEALSADNRGRR